MNIKNLKKEKKGSIQDVIFWVVVLLVFAMGALIVFKIFTAINTEVQASSTIPATSKAISTRMLGYFPTLIDSGFVFFAIGLMIVTFILASLVRIHPIFFIFYIIGLIGVIFISGIISNIYTEMAAAPELIAQADQLVMISYIMRYLPFFTGIFGSILAIFMYKLYQNSSGAIE